MIKGKIQQENINHPKIYSKGQTNYLALQNICSQKTNVLKAKKNSKSSNNFKRSVNLTFNNFLTRKIFSFKLKTKNQNASNKNNCAFKMHKLNESQINSYNRKANKKNKSFLFQENVK